MFSNLNMSDQARGGFGKHVTFQWHWIGTLMAENRGAKPETLRRGILGNTLFMEEQGTKLEPGIDCVRN